MNNKNNDKIKLKLTIFYTWEPRGKKILEDF